MDRRTLLTTTSIVLSGLLTGCVDSLRADTSTGDNNSDDEANTETDRSDPESGTHHLYLVNLSDESQQVDLMVVDRNSDDTVLEGTYEIPAERGGEFREIAHWEETYEVTATLKSGLSETFCWEIEGCPGPKAEDDESELPDGSRNGGVRIEPDAADLSFIADNCDEIIAGTAVATGPARQFEVEESEE